MSEDDNFLAEAFRRQLSGLVTPEAIRAIESGGSHADLWHELEGSGFADAMLPVASGGAGLDLSQVFPLIAAAGEYCVPLPFAETMVSRGMLAVHGIDVPAGSAIVLAPNSATIPGARFASNALASHAGSVALVCARALGGDLFGTGGATQAEPGDIIATLDLERDALLCAAAAVAAGQMTGAMARVMEMSLYYASERQQFGRSLGKFQAIQQQLAVLAEQVLSAQVAVRGAFYGTVFDPVRVAAAKCRANEAATQVCNIAHAIHGAIGITEEFDLQLYTRRIKQWQIAFGSESYWGARLGRARISSGLETTADFLRLQLANGVE